MFVLWHKRYGFLKMDESPNNQWVTFHPSKGSTRYGAFRSDYMSIAVNLPLDEVMVTHIA